MKNIVDTLDLNNLIDYANKNFVPIVRKQTAQFLFDLVSGIKPKNILEIGTAIGFSGTILLNASENAYLTTVEKDVVRYDIAVNTFKKLNKSQRVNAINDDALIVLKSLKESIEKGEIEKFDFVFFDGPKGQYLKHFKLLLPLLSDSAVVFCDNIYFNGLVKEHFDNPHLVKRKNRTIVVNMVEFLNYIKDNEGFETTIHNIEDGVAIIKKIK